MIMVKYFLILKSISAKNKYVNEKYDNFSMKINSKTKSWILRRNQWQFLNENQLKDQIVDSEKKSWFENNQFILKDMEYQYCMLL